MEKLKKIYRDILPAFIRKPIRDWRFEKEFHIDAEVEFYGAYNLLLKHLMQHPLPYILRKRINWQHGWYPDYYQEGTNDPFITTQNHDWNKQGYFNFVARKTEEEKLKSLGVKNTMATGLPIVYTPARKIERIKGSLLVMPGHSLDYISLTTNEEAYVEYINSLRPKFKKITICIHPSCLRNGYWINTFRKNNYEIVIGVEISDQRSFYKLQQYFSQYEYCTSNLTGSHTIYAAFFGCKVSLVGPRPDLSIQDIEDSDYWKDRPDKSALLHSFQKMSLNEFEKHYPSFFAEHPLQAKQQVELALHETGFDNKITPGQYKEVITWIKNNYSEKC